MARQDHFNFGLGGWGLDGKCLLHLGITTIDLLKPFYKLSQIVENDFNTMSDGRAGDDHIEFESDTTIVENLVSHCRAGFNSCQDKQEASLAKEQVTMEKERVAAAAAKDEAKKAIDKAEEKVKKRNVGDAVADVGKNGAPVYW